MTNPSPTTETAFRVRYAETDATGVVYYAHFFTYFEVGRNEHFRQRGIPLAQLEAEGFFEAIAEAQCAYRRPARYDDPIIVRTTTAELRRRAFRLEYQVQRQEEDGRRTLLAEGYTVSLFLDGEGNPVELPERVRAALGNRT